MSHRPASLRYLLVLLGLCGSLAVFGASAHSTGLPFTLERLQLPGPVSAAVIRLDLTDPHVQVKVALADARDPDGAGPAVGLLDTPSQIAKRMDFAITVNASFFSTLAAREVDGKSISYFVGNGAYPVGWHFSDGKLISTPQKAGLRATMIVHHDGKISLSDNLQQLPPDTRYAVSGNAMMLTRGAPTPPSIDLLRHPRSAVGLSEDGKTLFLIAVDGRQEQSRGVTLAELARMFLQVGAYTAINLDGGGSTSLVVKDPAVGTYSIVNRPSDTSPSGLSFSNERPVVDVIGVVLQP